MFKIKNIFSKKKQQQHEKERESPITDFGYDTIQEDLIDENNVDAAPNLMEETTLMPSIPIDILDANARAISLSSTTKVSSDISITDDINGSKYIMKQNEMVLDDKTPEEELDSIATSASSTDEEETPDEHFPEQLELKGYTLINKIGEGAFSRVFRGIPQKSSSKAFLTKNYNEVAIKVIQKQNVPVNGKKNTNDQSSKASSKEQVLKEVTIHKLVSSGDGSAQIVEFIDFQESKHFYYIVQELLSGGEIFGEIVKYTYFSEDLSRHIIKQLALAVQHLHVMGVVHRDIKPENLLFEPIEHVPSKNLVLRSSDDPNTKLDEGEFRPDVGGGGIGIVKLADFGLSKQIYQANTKTPCGTVGYTAPEVVKDERYSMKVDMWGIGCVLYTILCGFPPFYDEKIDILTEKIARGEYSFLRPWWDEISPGAKNAVKKLLEVDPEKRYDVDELLNDPWLNSYDTLKQEQLELRKKRKSKNHYYHKKKMLIKKENSLLYSPAAVAMRDAFDVSNAVQRIEGDKREVSVPLHSLAEDEEISNDNNGTLEQNLFQLRLNSSTIVKRRKENKPQNIPIIPIPTLIEQ